MHDTAVINVVGLTPDLIGDDTPFLRDFAARGACQPLETVTPAVTCSAQSTFVTGRMPSDHGIVGNGWYFRDTSEVRFWLQPDGLVEGEKVWETARRRDSGFTAAKMFWWYNMYSAADYSVTPRPMYPADGRKILDVYGKPDALVRRLKSEIGEFPFFNFWGPQADIRSSQWIAESALRVAEWHSPTLNLVYLPHLDYNLQRVGPNHPDIKNDLGAIDVVCRRLIDRFEERGTRVIVLSEYGVTEVTGPVHINRVLREAGLLIVREEAGLEMLDAGASEAFAVSDHQVAHVYVKDRNRISEVSALLETTPGIERVLDRSGQREIGLDHPRSGELVAISEADRWFTYYYWLDDAVAPDFARTVDIHRKPGYDPVELFVDPKLMLPAFTVARTLVKKKLGFRYLMEVIGLDAGLVRGSHGRPTDDPGAGPMFITDQAWTVAGRDRIHATDVKGLILKHIFDNA